MAMLWYRRGKLDQAAELLRAWCDIEPENALPLIRLAIVQHQRADTKSAFKRWKRQFDALAKENLRICTSWRCHSSLPEQATSLEEATSFRETVRRMRA